MKTKTELLAEGFKDEYTGGFRKGEDFYCICDEPSCENCLYVDMNNGERAYSVYGEADGHYYDSSYCSPECLMKAHREDTIPHY